MNDARELSDSQKKPPKNRLINIGLLENNDIVEYEHSSKPWEALVRPLGSNPFSQRVTYLVTPFFTLFKDSFTAAIHKRGLTPPGMLGFLIPLRLGQKSSFWNSPPCRHGLTACMPGEFDAVIDAGQEHIIVLIDLCLLERLLPETQLSALKHAAASHVLPASEQARWNLRQWLEYLLDRAQREPSYFQLPEVLRSLEDELVRLLISTIDLPSGDTARPALSKRSHGYQQALEYLRDADLEDLTIPTICQKAGISQRTLEYAFREHLNMTPHNFIKLLRLHSIRRNLSTAQVDETTVTDIAFQHGVYNIGRFAQVYEQNFGELPSQTLRKPKMKSLSPFFL